MVLILAYIFATTSLSSGIVKSETDLITIRNLYVQSVKSKEDNQRMIDFLAKQRQTPVVKGYLGGAHFIMASHAFAPWNKLSEFRTGKKILEQAIVNAPHEPELRFIRLSIQSNLPGFLNYSEHITGDTKFLQESLPGIADADLRKRINDWFAR